MQSEIKVVCCDCGKLLGVKEGNGQTGISHTYCEKCLVKFKKEIWGFTHNAKTDGKYYHPWATDGGKFMVFESEPYRGGIMFSKVGECENLKEIEDLCDELNRGE